MVNPAGRRELTVDGNFSNLYPVVIPNPNIAIQVAAPAVVGNWSVNVGTVACADTRFPELQPYAGQLPYDVNRHLLSLFAAGRQAIVTQQVYLPRSGQAILQFYYTRKPAARSGETLLGADITRSVDELTTTSIHFGQVLRVATLAHWYPAQIQIPIGGNGAAYLKFLQGADSDTVPNNRGCLITSVSLRYLYLPMATLLSPAPQQGSVTTPVNQVFPAFLFRMTESVTGALLTRSDIVFTLSPAGSGIRFANGAETYTAITDDAGNATIPAGQLLAGSQGGARVSLLVSCADDPAGSVPLAVGEAPPPPPTGDAYYVRAVNGDMQDAVAGHAYDAPLVVEVFDATNQVHATTGVIRYKALPGTPDLQFYGGPGADITVANGQAQSPTLYTGTAPISEYGQAQVQAYPADLDIPVAQAGAAGRLAVFTERVWKTASAIITPQGGDGQQTPPGTAFPLSLAVLATAASAAPVPQLLLRAAMTGPAVFDRSDAGVAVVYVNEQTVLMRTDASGRARMPRVVAGQTEGSVYVNVSSPVAASPAHFSLRVSQETAPTDGAKYEIQWYGTSEGLQVQSNMVTTVGFIVRDIATERPAAGKPMAISIDNSQDHTEAQFLPAGDDPACYRQNTDSDGVVRAQIYTGLMVGTFALKATLDSNDADDYGAKIQIVPT